MWCTAHCCALLCTAGVSLQLLCTAVLTYDVRLRTAASSRLMGTTMNQPSVGGRTPASKRPSACKCPNVSPGNRRPPGISLRGALALTVTRQSGAGGASNRRPGAGHNVASLCPGEPCEHLLPAGSPWKPPSSPPHRQTALSAGKGFCLVTLGKRGGQLRPAHALTHPHQKGFPQGKIFFHYRLNLLKRPEI